MFRNWLGTAEVRTLSLSYNRNPVGLKAYTAKDKKVLCESLLDTELDDYTKLYPFLFLQKHEFYPLYIKFNSAVNECLDFMRKYKSKGYTSFISVIEYDVMTPNNVYGNHYIIACMKDVKVDSIMDRLTKRLALYKRRTLPCVVLKNYTEESETRLDILFPDIINNLFSDPIMLGKLVKKTRGHDKDFDKQVDDLRAADMAKDLLRSIRRCLNLPAEYQTAIDEHAFKVTSDAFTMLVHCLETLHTAKSLSDIRNMLQNANDQLIIFVSNYYYYLQSVYESGAEITNHNKIYGILHQIYNWIKRQGYKTIDDVFCMVYHGENAYYKTPVIYVTDTNIHSLLSVFKVKRFSSLKLRLVRFTNEADDYLIEFGNGNSQKEPVSLCQYSVTNSPQEETGSTMPYATQCVNQHAGRYNWICMKCEELVKGTSQARLVCACGSRPSPSTNLECFKCALNNGRLQLPGVENETDAQAEVFNACREEDRAEVSIVKRTRELAKAEPVSFLYSFRSVTATDLLTKEDESLKAEIVINLSHYYTIHLNVPKPSTYTVLVIGSSGAGKSPLLNSIYCMQQHKTLENAVQCKIQCLLPVTLEETGEAFDGIHENNVNEHYAGVGQSVTQHPKDYVLDYGTFKIRFVDTPGITDTRGFDQDAENIKFIQEHLLKLKEVHAVMFVIKNSEVKLSAEFENTMLALFGILPRTAIQNCFFVYTFAAPDFQPGAARTPLTTLLAKFSKQHNVELSLDTSNEYCVDNGILRKLLHCQKSSERFAISSYADYWKANSESISRMFQDVIKVNPILCEDFKLAAKMKELGDVLRPYGKGDKGELTSDAKRLMASVANGSLHGIAIYCRNKSEGEKSIGNDEWETVQEVWRAKDEGVLKKAAEIDALIKDLQQAQRDAAPGGTVRDVGIVDTVEYLPVYENNKDIGHRSEDHLTEANDQPEPSVMPIAVTVYAERFGNSVRSISCHQEVDLQKTSTDYGPLLDERVFNVREPIIDVEHVSIDVANNDNLVSNADVNAPDVQLSSLLAPTECQTTPLVTILVIGTSETNNKAFIECVYRGKQKELEQASKSYAPVKEPGRRTTNGCIIDYGSYEVGFISLVDSDSPINWKLYPEVHGFIFVTSVYSSYPPDDLQLRKSLGRVPRNALKNCCIVISTSAASTALSDYMIKFHSEHALEDEINHFSVDSDLIKCHEYTTRHYVDTLDTIKSNVEELIFTIAESPVTFNELKVTECLTQIGDTLFAKVTITQAEKRLLATVVSKTMSVLAQRIRKKYGNNIAAPLSDHEWHAADNWEISENLLRYVREINGYINPVMNFEQQSDISSTRL